MIFYISEFQKQVELVAVSWAKEFEPNTLVIAYMDFVDGQEIFQEMKLSSVPHVLHYPPASTTPVPYDISRNGLQAKSVIDYLNSNTGANFKLYVPVNYQAIATMMTTVVAFLGLSFVFKNQVLLILGHKKLWTVAILGLVVTMNSGFMWNVIRTPGYSGMENGK